MLDKTTPVRKAMHESSNGNCQYYREGYEAFNNFLSFGKDVMCPYIKGSKEYREWQRGYDANYKSVNKAEDYFSSDYV